MAETFSLPAVDRPLAANHSAVIPDDDSGPRDLTVDEIDRLAPTNGHNRGPVPPHDVDAEASVIGYALIRPDRHPALAAAARPADFYQPSHGTLWATIGTLAADNELTVENLAARADTPPVRLAELTVAAAPSHQAALANARLVADHARRRRIITAARQLTDDAYDTATPDSFADRTVGELLELTQPAGRDDTARPIADLLPQHLDLLEARHDGTAPLGAPTGWAELDRTIAGLRPGQLVVVAARPSIGKSAFGPGQLALNSTAAGHPTLVCSVEMPADELLDRWLAATTGLGLGRLRDGTFGPRDWDRIAAGVTTLVDHQRAPLWVYDAPAQTVPRIAAETRRHQPAVVIVDYLQILDAHEKHQNRAVEVQTITRGLKQLARREECCVVALCQLNRELEKRGDKRPVLADLRDSGAIEQDADLVVCLYRDDYYNAGGSPALEVLVRKNRQGPLGTVTLNYDRSTGRITEQEAP